MVVLRQALVKSRRYPPAMDPGARPADDEMDDIVAQMVRKAGLLAIASTPRAPRTWTLTRQVVQVAPQLAMGDETAFNAILDAVEGIGRDW